MTVNLQGITIRIGYKDFEIVPVRGPGEPITDALAHMAGMKVREYLREAMTWHMHTFWIDGGNDVSSKVCTCELGEDHADATPEN